MTLSYERLRALREQDVPFAYDERDSMLYALSIGMGRNPTDERELPFVFEGWGLKVMPTQAILVCVPGMIWDIGLDVEKFLHGEQSFRFHQPMPAAARILNDARVAEVYDKGSDRGCLLELEGTARFADGEPLVSWTARIMARGDSGIGTDRKVPPPHAIPDREPDIVDHSATRPEQALLYRLNGDRNLVHVDPRVAGDAGFPVPILHGACTASIACRAILRHVCDYDPAAIAEFDVRWTAPVFPGETIETAIWIDGDTLSFRCTSVERGRVVIDHGRCRLREPAASNAAGIPPHS
jgi:acyl dehydratase